MAQPYCCLPYSALSLPLSLPAAAAAAALSLPLLLLLLFADYAPFLSLIFSLFASYADADDFRYFQRYSCFRLLLTLITPYITMLIAFRALLHAFAITPGSGAAGHYARTHTQRERCWRG